MLRRSPLLLALLLPLLALACSNVLVEPGEGSGGASAAGTTATSTGTSSTTTTGGGGAPACGETHDTVSILLSTYEGKSYGCKGSTQGNFEMEATVVDAGTDFLSLDSCPPNADCLPHLSKLSVSAAGLDLGATPKGNFVRVEIQSYLFMGGCGHKVLVTNLPSWAGAPNPVEQGERLWLMAADGAMGPFDDSPLTMEAVPLGCYPDEPPGCGDHDDYLWRFRSASSPADPATDLAMGQTYGWYFTNGPGSQKVLGRNLRSFAVGYCDGPVEFAYWVINAYGVD
jgi:hypothetical protein